MTAQKKLILMLSISLSLLLAAMLIFLYFGKVRHEAIQERELEGKQFAVDMVLKHSDDYLMKFVVDYSLWDEMTNFVTTRDQSWANDNINTLLKTTQIKYVWIYNSQKELVYNLIDNGFSKIQNPLPIDEFERQLEAAANSKKRFCHFYIKNDSTIIEISGATIHKSEDYERNHEAKGFLFFAKILDPARVKELEFLTNSKVILDKNSKAYSSGEKFETVVAKHLPDWQGKPIASLSFVSQDKLGRSEDKYNKLSLIVYLLVIVIVIMFAYMMINRSITGPLSKIVMSLDSENADQIKDIMNNKDEFGQIAELINKFFDQRNEIRTQYDKISEQNLLLEDLNATKDKFFSIIAHDLKNPFGVILATTEFIANPNYDLTKEEIIEFSSDLNETVRNLFNLLENLLTWARSQRGKIQFNPANIKISDISEAAIYVLKSQAEAKGIKIVTELEAGLECYADSNMVNTILRNITSNAIKFTYTGGTIKITAKNSSDGLVEVAVEDNGMGMSEENIQKLFRIDVNMTTPGTSKEKGTGLGLILCKEFVEKHGGTIVVESKPGAGSKFKFTLPAKGVEAEEVAAEQI